MLRKLLRYLLTINKNIYAATERRIDAIVFIFIFQASDGVILGRQFMACEILEPNKMSAIQLHLSAMCKKVRIYNTSY